MSDEISRIDLSEFGLSEDSGSPASPPAALSSSALSPNVLQELGMEDFGQPSPATNGQEAMPSVEASVPFDTSFDAPERPRRQQAPMPDLPKVQGMAPSTGFGILEQILLELTACNLELRALRQTLSNPQATGPSVLASPAGAQASSQPTLPASGDASPTADAPARPRRRGRPPATSTKKEGDEFGLE